MHISQKGLELIERFEGLSLKRYQTRLPDGSLDVPTIGFGTTASVVDPVPATCTLTQAEGWLRLYVERNLEPILNAVIAKGVHLNGNMYDACCSIGYNEGGGILSDTANWTFARDLHAGNLKALADDFLRYVNAGGRPILAARRHAERDYFLTPWIDPDPHHYLWFDDTDRSLGGNHHGSERVLVTEYDAKRKHAAAHKVRLNTLRNDMGILAGRLETVMHDDPKNADADHKPWRHAGLAGRADGRRYV